MLCLREARTFRDACGRTRAVSSEFTVWADLNEALLAEAVLCDPRCGPSCEGHHAVVWADGGRVRVQPGSHNPATPDLAHELAALYPRDPVDKTRWPVPTEYNQPLADGRGGSELAERIARGQRVAVLQATAVVAPWQPYADDLPPAGT